MSSLSDLKRRLESVKQTRRITGAMKTVSVAKMRKAEEKFDNCRAYTDLLTRIMSALAMSEETSDDICFHKPETGKKLVLVLSTDRGLCGGFDNEIIKLANKHIDENTIVMPIGKAASEYFKRFENADMRFSESYLAEHYVAEKISGEILKMYGHGVRQAVAVYSEMTSHSSYKPTVKTILPVQKSECETEKTDFMFEPSKTELLNTIIPLYVSASVYGVFVNNTVAEHCARRAAMSAATDSADSLIDSLSVEYNRARQATVTEQIIEIIGSTGALEKQGEGNEKRP